MSNYIKGVLIWMVIFWSFCALIDFTFLSELETGLKMLYGWVAISICNFIENKINGDSEENA